MKPIPKSLRKKIRQLRHSGKTHREISGLFKVGLGTAFKYSRGIKLTKAQHYLVKKRVYDKVLKNLPREKRVWSKRKGNFLGGTPKYSREKLLEYLKEFNKKNGRIPVKREFMAKYRAFLRVFGTWNKAIEAAGLSPNPVLFAKKYTANDGHRCDSLAEKIIDDWFFARKIKHKINFPYPNSKYTADFKVGDILIEFFGLHGELKSYDQLMEKKLNLVKEYNLKLISIYPKDIFPEFKLDQVFGCLITQNSIKNRN